MQWWSRIRRRVLVEGVPKRQVLREEGIHWKTLTKILENPEPPGYRRKQSSRKPVIGPHLDTIQYILKQDSKLPKKQRHTAKRIFERLRDERGYKGCYTQVKEAVREYRSHNKEVYMPLVHRPGEAQMDFGYALAKIAGQLCKVVLFVLALPFSDAVFVQAFQRITTEVFWEGHRRAFEFFDGVPRRISYDNERIMVAQVLGAHRRKPTRGFLQLQSHYLFEEHFCTVRRANEKGVVEGLVKYVRLNFMVPVPEVQSLEELNQQLIDRCRGELQRKLRGKGATKGELLEQERSELLPLPPAPFDACQKVATTASSLSLVRFDGNDYSVPVRYGHRPVVVKGYVDRVEVYFKDERIALHRRLWVKEDVSFDPVHYLGLLKRKPGALDHGRPLLGWELPECFGVLRSRLETEQKGEGTREYIKVLRLLEIHSMHAVARAVNKGLEVNGLTRDVIAQFLYPQEDWGQRTFRLDGREHLRYVKVAQTDISGYGELLSHERRS
jgi:transposase